MKKLLVSLACIAGIVILPACEPKSSVTITNAWVREAPPGANVLAAYMTISNHTGAATRLIAANSSCCGSIEMHESGMQDGVMRMMQHDSIELPAASNVDFQPGGLHLMLFDPVKALRAGDSIELKLEFADQPSIELQVPVRHASDMNDQQHMHNH